MQEKTIAVVQARMGSSRFPGKSLVKIGNWSLIELVLERVSHSSKIDKIILATTTNQKDDVLVAHVKKLGFEVFRGSEQDVLSRFYNALSKFKPKVVVRITGDCPLISPQLIDMAVKRFSETKADYLSLSIGEKKKLAYPRGFDVEVTSFKALSEANNKAEKKYEREHVMPYLYTHKDIYSIIYQEPEIEESRPSYRLCVDTQNDLELLNAIFGFYKENLINISYQEIIKFLDDNPHIPEINKDVEKKHFNVADD